VGTYTELKGGIVFSFCDVVLPGARTFDCVYHAAEFSEDTVAHKLDYAAAVFGDQWFDQILTKAGKYRHRSCLVLSHDA